MKARRALGALAAPLLAAVLLAAPCSPAAAAGPALDRDGWYRWEVAAAGAGRSACCYRFRGGTAAQVGCRLDGGDIGHWSSADCAVSPDPMRIYVQVQDRRVVDIQAFSATCPVEAGASVEHLADISTEQSIEWLLQQVDANPPLLEEALMAISFHADPAALEALSGVLEDRGRRMEAREQALFWLVQTDSDLAYAYLDRLLGAGG